MVDPTNLLRIGRANSLAGVLGIIAVLMAPGSAIRAQADGERLALALRNNVVGIAAARAGGERSGFGIIVGERAGRVFIATANHVVRGIAPGEVATRIRVRFFQRRDEEYDAKLLGTSDARYDLAILEVAAPAKLDWHRESLRLQPDAPRGTEVWFVGRDDSWYIPTRPGRLSRVTLDFRIDVDDLEIRVGSSGAPLMAADGIVGMLLVDETTGASSALAIEIIERAIRLWDLPWDLKPIEARAAIPTLAPDVETHLSAGDRFLQVGQIDRAVEQYEEARKYDARNTVVLLRLVKALRSGLWQHVHRTAIDVDPENELLFDLSVLRDRSPFDSAADRALKVLYEAQGINKSLKNDKEWLLEEARIRWGSGYWLLAQDVLTRAHKMSPDDADIMSELGLLVARTVKTGATLSASQHQEGLALLQRAVAARPGDARFHRRLGYALLPSDEAQAVREYFTAMTLGADDDGPEVEAREGARRELTARLRAFGWRGYQWTKDALPPGEAIKIAQHVRPPATDYKSRPWIDLLLASAHFELGNFTDAVRICRESLPKDLDEVWEDSYVYLRDFQGPFLVMLGRILERSGTDAATLLAIQSYLGKPNVLGAVLRNSRLSWGDTRDRDVVRVERVIWGGLVQELGLKRDDAIVAVDGVDTGRLSLLTAALARKKPDEGLQVRVVKEDGRSGPHSLNTRMPGRAGSGPAQLGIQIRDEYDRDKHSDRRIKIVAVTKNSPGEKAGLTAGDSIESINGIDLIGGMHLIYILSGFSPGSRVPLVVERESKTLELMPTLEAFTASPPR
jgi:S1-C subfamily serine protease/tetratricopeptide (TPR) repeat protein